MCKKTATTVEHAPPKCLFPEKNDLPPGVILRKNLITVPSCDEHNSQKQKDDEYLRLCLLMNIANNDTAFTLFSSKVSRAMERNPELFKHLTRERVPVVAVDKETGEAINTLMVKVDSARLLKSLEHIARAIFFHQCGNRFEGRCVILYDFGLYHGRGDDAKWNDFIQITCQQMKDYFDPKAHAGDNPEVFKYFLENVDKGFILKMQFYGGGNVFAAFVPQ